MAIDGIQPPIVTIVVSCYNHAEYIEECIHSIIRQTYAPIELLTYDDGSRDNSPQVLEKLAEKYNFSFTAQQNRGLSETLNHALERARGKYFCPIGSDDIMLLDKTEKQVAFLEANAEVAVCGGNALLIDGNGQLCARRQRFHPSRDLSFRDLFENSTPGFISPTAMIRTQVLRDIGGYDPNIPLEDLYLWLKIADQGKRIHALNDALLYYRKHPNNTYKNISFMYHCISKTLEQYRDHPRYADVMGRHLNSLLLNASKHGERDLFRDILKRLSYSQYNSKTLRAIINYAFKHGQKNAQ